MQRFERIHEEHADAVRAYVRRRAPGSLVDDVVADVFVVALRRIDDVPREALPWLYAVARQTLANERRDVLVAAPEASDEPEPAGDPQLAAAFAALSDADREILRLVAWEGLSLRHAARVLECSPVAARVRLHRALPRIRCPRPSARGVGGVGTRSSLRRPRCSCPRRMPPTACSASRTRARACRRPTSSQGSLSSTRRSRTCRSVTRCSCSALSTASASTRRGTRPAVSASRSSRVLTFPGRLQGIAADGVATVRFVDASGNVLDSTPVTDNLFASRTRIGPGVAAAVEALDANGTILSTQKMHS